MTLLQIRKGTDAYFVFILYNQIKYNKNEKKDKFILELNMYEYNLEFSNFIPS